MSIQRFGLLLILLVSSLCLVTSSSDEEKKARQEARRNQEIKFRKEGLDCQSGSFLRRRGRTLGCCVRSGCCKDSSCKVFGFKNSGRANCAWVKQGEEWKEASENPSECRGLVCHWTKEDCLVADDAKCYGTVKCSDDTICGDNPLVNNFCLQDGNNGNNKKKRGSARKINFKICACDADNDCQSPLECTDRSCEDPFNPSGDPDDECDCEDRYRNQDCLDLEDGKQNREGLPSTSGFIKVTIPQCGIEDAMTVDGQKLVDKYGCAPAPTCDQDWICAKHVEQADLDFNANQMNMCYTETLMTKEDAGQRPIEV